MSDKEKQIMDVFSQIVPKLSELDKEKLLAFGEGLAFKVKQEYGDAS